ncbi:hypothetical protein BS50DRAFT_620277 [Corynespora cassiicola Philippines]|uniref:Uncharacterized protein n=1 Tax=Corynespora cassiicola Philippines TaxID=1448308 RepID=A0A2T2NQX1_CORCC|nr:hypothetical protein BS50DRAFT_620277 [Corynespora cassiicola Philippines]
MPPIPIHKNDPILPTAAKADAASTPQTANPPPTRTAPASIPATTTASSSNPPPPQPGARPIAPTAAQPPPPSSSAYAPAGAGASPPAPQPGAAPGTGGAGGYTATSITTETTRLANDSHTLPPQFRVPPPTDSQLVGRSTTTATQASKPGPTSLNLGPAQSPFQSAHSQGAVPSAGAGEERRSLEHPPGYIQALDNTPYSAGPQHHQQQQGGESDESVGGAAWSMLAKAGEALKKGEEAAWRAVRNK